MLPSPKRHPLRLGLLALAICIIAIVAVREGSLLDSVKSLASRRQLDPPPISNLPTRTDWTFSSTPEFCKHLVANPVQRAPCRRDRDTQRCSDGRYMMMSQLAQDFYLYTRHFSHLKRRGIYVDIAANDPTLISNTYFMDACLGWDGICVEANPIYFEPIRKYRSCMLVDTCVGDVEGENITFLMGGVFGGISDTNKNVNSWLKKGHKTGEVQLTCKTMASVIRETDITVVDYMSLDVEGHELKVLKGFDWSRFMIKVMTVEVKAKALREISEFLETKGYVRHTPTLNERTISSRRLSGDAVFLHESVAFGAPI